MSSGPYFCAVDLGQAQDPTAIAISQVAYPPSPPPPLFWDPSLPAVERPRSRPVHEVGYLERLPLNTPYPSVVRHVKALINRDPFYRRCEIVVDATGVGAAVADLFAQEGVRAIKVVITSGDSALRGDDGVWRVGKIVLVSIVQALVHDERLKVAAELPEAPLLRAELDAFRATVTDAGNWRFGARVGAHDDLVLAVALACWKAQTNRPFRLSPATKQKLASRPRRPRPTFGMGWYERSRQRRGF
jgi:hypothetical protein